jgi:predicted NAD/FAD-dependent oxidoreductase
MSKKIAIIGAGIAGISTARLLGNVADVTLFDKARGVGGRMSIRRADPFCFDHGAQYFTARTPDFQNFIRPSIDTGLIKRWDARHVLFDKYTIISRKNWLLDEPRYVGVPGMNSLVKELSKGLTIYTKTKITSLKWHKGFWDLLDDQGNTHSGFDWVISTMPSPQAAELLTSTFKHYEDIRSIQMRPCFSLMLGFSGKFMLDFDAAHVSNSDVSWIGVNSSKPGRSNFQTLVVHSTECYAKEHLEAERDAVMKALCDETSHIIGREISGANFKALHAWHFANNDKHLSLPSFLDYDLKLAACGDWCQGGRVEGAFSSAVNLVTQLKKYLKDC